MDVRTVELLVERTVPSQYAVENFGRDPAGRETRHFGRNRGSRRSHGPRTDKQTTDIIAGRPKSVLGLLSSVVRRLLARDDDRRPDAHPSEQIGDVLIVHPDAAVRDEA